MARFWISWVQDTEDHRPLAYPPNKSVLGWWCSGYDAYDRPVICAAVEARQEADARDAILKEWPEALNAGDWRFFERRQDDFAPGDRFPLSDWMRERFQPVIA